MYKNWKTLKSEINKKSKEYLQVAEWCNNNYYPYPVGDEEL